MNKKIFELAEQARELTTVRNSEGVALSLNRDKFEQKFAELIIRDCAYIWLMNPEGHPNLLLDHFEVE